MTPEEAAVALAAARHARRTLSPFTDRVPDLDEDWGYAAQAAGRRTAAVAGARLVGAKLGLTSAAKQRRMGVDRPIVGYLTQDMLLDPAEVGDRSTAWAQPRVEPEIAFVTGRRIDRALPDAEVEGTIAAVAMAVEVIDSRWTDYRFRLADVVADNTSAAGVVVHPTAHRLGELGDLGALRCRVTVDGDVVHEATGAAILGDPLRAVQLLSEHLERHGETLPAGSLVLAGALTDAVPLNPGHSYELGIAELGTVRLGPAG